jgi:phosphoribosylamine--glycine ligase/phosphoribosylformylglycinamidine cyclo-ligase
LKVGIPCFGPSKEAAQLEGSKAFAKDFMQRHGIPTAKYRNFDDFMAGRKYLETVPHKASGLAAGKGVLMPTSREEGISALERIMLSKEFGDAGNEVVIEELLAGDDCGV